MYLVSRSAPRPRSVCLTTALLLLAWALVATDIAVAKKPYKKKLAKQAEKQAMAEGRSILSSLRGANTVQVSFAATFDQPFIADCVAGKGDPRPVGISPASAWGRSSGSNPIVRHVHDQLKASGLQLVSSDADIQLVVSVEAKPLCELYSPQLKPTGDSMYLCSGAKTWGHFEIRSERSSANTSGLRQAFAGEWQGSVPQRTSGMGLRRERYIDCEALEKSLMTREEPHHLENGLVPAVRCMAEFLAKPTQLFATVESAGDDRSGANVWNMHTCKRKDKARCTLFPWSNELECYIAAQ